MSRRGRSTTGFPEVPYYLGTRIQESVKHLRLICTRYLDERASEVDLREALTITKKVLDEDAGEKR